LTPDPLDQREEFRMSPAASPDERVGGAVAVIKPAAVAME
jgi:hypothetical protein